MVSMIDLLRSPALRLLFWTAVGCVAVGVGLVAWLRPSERAAGELPGVPAVLTVSPEVAEATLDRVESFRAGLGGELLALGDAELSSVVRYALPGILPQGVTEPVVDLLGERLALSARVATAAFPDLPALDPLVGMLPDTVVVRLAGVLTQFGKESLAFRMDEIEVARIPLPDRLVPEILEAFGRSHRGDLPPNALHVPLPGGLDSVYVLRDSLMLVARR